MGLFGIGEKKYTASQVAEMMRHVHAHGVGAGPMMMLPSGGQDRFIPGMRPLNSMGQWRPGNQVLVPHPTIPGASIAVPMQQGGAQSPPLQGAGQGAPGVQLQYPTEYRQYTLGIDSVVDVPAGGSLQINTQVQLPFRGKRLLIGGDIADSFSLGSIFVGVDFQGAANTALPGFLFVPESLVPMELDTANVGNIIAINVTNNSVQPIRFVAMFQGDVVR